MKCEHCENESITQHPFLCKKHFDTFMLETVQETIEKYKLFTKEDIICIGLSGGKDSLSLADILLRLGYTLAPLFVDEGIDGYRDAALENVKLFAQQRNLDVTYISFKEEYGFTLNEAMTIEGLHACTMCGTLRRQLLNRFANKFPVIAIGHNVDDGAQTTLINLARGNTDLLLRQGPQSKENKLFTQRVKPLYFIKEEFLDLYVDEHNITVKKGPCPYSPQSYRGAVKIQLNELQKTHPYVKQNIVKTYLELKEKLLKNNSPPLILPQCTQCGDAAQGELCKACQIVKHITTKLT